MRIDPKIKRDFNLTGEQLEFMEMLRKEAETIPVPMILEPDMVKQRLPSKPKTPAWRVLSPVMAAVAACFAVLVVGQQTIGNIFNPGIVSAPGITDSMIEPSFLEPSDSSVSDPSSDQNANASNQQSSSLPEDNLSQTVESKTGSDTSSAWKEPASSNATQPSNGGSVSLPPSNPENPGGGEIVSTEYSSIYQKIQQLNGKNPAQVKGVARAANFSAIFGNNSSLLSTRQTDVGSQTDTAQFDGKYIYAISESVATGAQSVVIYQADGENGRWAAELSVDFGMQSNSQYEFTDIHLLNCYVNQGQLTVVGSASYKRAGSAAPVDGSNIMTAVATYDISTPEHPVLISNVYQDGILLSSRLSGGFLYLVTRKTVSDPVGALPESYLPLQMANGRYRTVSTDDIHISPYAESPCYIVASSILLKQPASFYDTAAILGDSSELYISDSNIYLADYTYRGGNTYTTIVQCGYGKGNFDYIGGTALLGRLYNSEAMEEYQNALRVITTRGNNNTLYVLDDRLTQIGGMEDVTEGQKLKSVQFHREKIYFVTAEESNSVTLLDVSDVAQSVKVEKLGLSDRTMPMIPFGDDRMVNLELQTGAEPGLRLSLYDMLSPRRIIMETASALVAEGDVYSEAIDNRQALLTIPEQGLIGFSYFKYDNKKGESGCYYLLCQLGDDEEVVKKVEYRYPGKVYNQRGFVKDNVLYVVSSSSIVAFQIDSGKNLWQVDF